WNVLALELWEGRPFPLPCSCNLRHGRQNKRGAPPARFGGFGFATRVIWNRASPTRPARATCAHCKRTFKVGPIGRVPTLCKPSWRVLAFKKRHDTEVSARRSA